MIILITLEPKIRSYVIKVRVVKYGKCEHKKKIVKGTRQEIKTWRILGSRKNVDRHRKDI